MLTILTQDKYSQHLFPLSTCALSQEPILFQGIIGFTNTLQIKTIFSFNCDKVLWRKKKGCSITWVILPFLYCIICFRLCLQIIEQNYLISGQKAKHIDAFVKNGCRKILDMGRTCCFLSHLTSSNQSLKYKKKRKNIPVPPCTAQFSQLHSTTPTIPLLVKTVLCNKRSLPGFKHGASTAWTDVLPVHKGVQEQLNHSASIHIDNCSHSWKLPVLIV